MNLEGLFGFSRLAVQDASVEEVFDAKNENFGMFAVRTDYATGEDIGYFPVVWGLYNGSVTKCTTGSGKETTTSLKITINSFSSQGDYLSEYWERPGFQLTGFELYHTSGNRTFVDVNELRALAEGGEVPEAFAPVLGAVDIGYTNWKYHTDASGVSQDKPLPSVRINNMRPVYAQLVTAGTATRLGVFAHGEVNDIRPGHEGETIEGDYPIIYGYYTGLYDVRYSHPNNTLVTIDISTFKSNAGVDYIKAFWDIPGYKTTGFTFRRTGLTLNRDFFEEIVDGKRASLSGFKGSDFASSDWSDDAGTEAVRAPGARLPGFEPVREAVECSIRFDAGMEAQSSTHLTIPDPIRITYDGEVTLPAASRTGYKLLGWSGTGGGGAAFAPGEIVVVKKLLEDLGASVGSDDLEVTLHAKWEEAPTRIEAQHGQRIGAVATGPDGESYPIFYGYFTGTRWEHFEEWHGEHLIVDVHVETFMPNADYLSSWERTGSKLLGFEFKSTGLMVPIEELRAMHERGTMSFEGFLDSSFATPAQNKQLGMAESSITYLGFEPVYRDHDYMVLLHPGYDGAPDEEAMSAYGYFGDFVELPRLERYGFRFGGWDTERDGTGERFYAEAGAILAKDLTNMQGDSVNLFAQWVLRYDLDVPVADPGSVTFEADSLTGQVRVAPGTTAEGAILSYMAVPVALDSLSCEGLDAVGSPDPTGGAPELEAIFGAGSVSKVRFTATLGEGNAAHTAKVTAGGASSSVSLASLSIPAATSKADPGRLAVVYGLELDSDLAIPPVRDAAPVARLAYTVSLPGAGA